jgi:hypothetical protein
MVRSHGPKDYETPERTEHQIEEGRKMERTLEFLSNAEEEVLAELSDPETWLNNPVDREGMLFDWMQRVARAYIMTGRDRKSVEAEIPQLLSIIEGWFGDSERGYRAVDDDDNAKVSKTLRAKFRGTR